MSEQPADSTGADVPVDHVRDASTVDAAQDVDPSRFESGATGVDSATGDVQSDLHDVG